MPSPLGSGPCRIKNPCQDSPSPRLTPPQNKAKYSALPPRPPALWNLLSHSWD